MVVRRRTFSPNLLESLTNVSSVMMLTQYYERSGRLGLQTPVMVAIFACLMFPFGWLYAWLIREIPLVYINFLITCGFALVLGSATMQALATGHCRNRWIAILGSLCIGLAGWYSQWGAWLHMVLVPKGESFGWLTLCAHPRRLWQFLFLVNEVGAWSLLRSSENVSGFWLGFIWSLECLILLGGAMLGALAQTDIPYSEKLRKWFRETRAENNFGIVSDIPSLVASLEQNPREAATVLAQLQNSPQSNDSHAEVTLYQCPGEEIAYLCVRNIFWEIRDGKRKKRTESVISNLTIPAPVAAKIGMKKHDTP